MFQLAFENVNSRHLVGNFCKNKHENDAKMNEKWAIFWFLTLL